jgi:hypothetical protein
MEAEDLTDRPSSTDQHTLTRLTNLMEKIREDHPRVERDINLNGIVVWCGGCSGHWPCPTARISNEIEQILQGEEGPKA